MEALDARDLGHRFARLFEEVLDLIRVKGKRDDYMFLPVLLHYCAFLYECGRLNEYDRMLGEFARIGALYQW